VRACRPRSASRGCIAWEEGTEEAPVGGNEDRASGFCGFSVALLCLILIGSDANCKPLRGVYFARLLTGNACQCESPIPCSPFFYLKFTSPPTLKGPFSPPGEISVPADRSLGACWRGVPAVETSHARWIVAHSGCPSRTIDPVSFAAVLQRRK